MTEEQVVLVLRWLISAGYVIATETWKFDEDAGSSFAVLQEIDLTPEQLAHAFIVATS